MTSKAIRQDSGRILEYYFPKDSYVGEGVDAIVQGYLKGSPIRLDPVLVRRARREVMKKIMEIDASTYEFAQALHIYLHGRQMKRIIMLEGANLYGDQNIMDTVFAFDLGNNPHRLFKRSSTDGGPIDDYVSDRFTREMIADQRSHLRRNGFRVLEVMNSRFIYINEEDLGPFKESDGTLNLHALVPYIAPTNGYVGITPVSIPTEGQFRQNAPIITAYRQKSAITHKTKKRICTGKFDHPIGDWGGHFIETMTPEEATDRRNQVKGGIVLEFSRKEKSKGGFAIGFLDEDDYYSGSKKNDFKSFNIDVRVSSPRHPDVVREIQIVDRMQRFANQIDPNHPANYRNFKASQRLSKAQRERFAKFDPDLEDILGRPSTTFEL